MSSRNPVLVDREGGVGTLTLNRPDRRNALSESMIADLRRELAALADDPAIRVVLLRARGPAFCAGHDLAEMTAWRQRPDGGAGDFERLFASCSELMKAVQRHRRPVVAEVDGPAFAAGCQLVAACDLAYASDRARFATPGVQIGLFCSTPMVALGRNVARKHAMEMLLTGDAIDAARAAEIGLVNRCLPAAVLADEVRRLVHIIGGRSPAAIRYGKRAFHDQLEQPLDEAYAGMGRIMAENMLAGDACEGIDAFLARRPPVWPDPAGQA